MPFGAPAEVVGTPAFIAPECLNDRPLDQRVDLYALGALAYPLLLGSLERERAHVALLARDHGAFERSFAAMQTWFRTTQTPCLIQQCDLMLARAERPTRADLPTEVRAFEDLDGSTVIEVLQVAQKDASGSLRRRG
jgi:serine/threonine protein kinase